MFERRRIFGLEDVCANCTHGIGEIHVPHDDVAEILHHAKLDLIMFKSHIDILPAVPLLSILASSSVSGAWMPMTLIGFPL